MHEPWVQPFTKPMPTQPTQLTMYSCDQCGKLSLEVYCHSCKHRAKQKMMLVVSDVRFETL
jgi:recombinational DNA repair protein RecR